MIKKKMNGRKIITIYVSEDERKRIGEKAKERSLPIGIFCRTNILADCERMDLENRRKQQMEGFQ
jgi:hypothetical protein